MTPVHPPQPSASSFPSEPYMLGPPLLFAFFILFNESKEHGAQIIEVNVISMANPETIYVR